MLHHGIFDHAGIAVDMILTDFHVPGLDLAWLSPDACAALTDISTMTDAEYRTLADHCFTLQPALVGAKFCDLEGEPTKDLPQVLKSWSRAAVKALQSEKTRPNEMLKLIENIFTDGFFSGATTIADIDNAISDAVEMIGVQNPAALGTLLLRATGLVDADTEKLGADPSYEHIAGIPYALVLAYFARRAGISCEYIHLQDAYSALYESELKGSASALASGGTRSCEVHIAEAPEFVAHYPEALHIVAGSLLHILERDGDFAAVVAASDLLKDYDFTNEIDVSKARTIAEIAFAKSSDHNENVMRETLSGALDVTLPPIYLGDNNPNQNPLKAQAISERLTRALRIAHPEAKPISSTERHRELIKRMNDNY